MFFKTKKVESTPFSNFIRNAPVGERKRVYAEVLRIATESQLKIVRASHLKQSEQRLEHGAGG
jgi:hypothetical protein